MTRSLRLLALIGAATLGLCLALPDHARAQANLTFSGGNGTPLTVTLKQPIAYTITASVGANTAPYFDFEGLPFFFASVSGTITYSVNLGSSLSLSNFYPPPQGGVSPGSQNDAVLTGTQTPLGMGNMVTLNAGTLVSTSNFSAAPPANGSYPTFIFSAGATPTDISTTGVAVVPEPSAWALLGVGMGVLGLTLHRASRVPFLSVAVS